MDGFLALQDIGDDPDQKATRQGHNMLDMLDGLRLSILSGSLTFAQLQQLQQKVDNTTIPTSGNLATVMDDIKLRVRVELAKYHQKQS